MSRLRFTREEAKAEATRLATEFVARLPGTEASRCLGARPDGRLPKSRSSKHPVNWIVTFTFWPSDVVVDGGELDISVDLESKTVSTRQ